MAKKRKILILSASPVRDKIVDELISEKLKSLGNEVWVKPCLREGRDGILALKPDIVVLPPIRNMYSRDMCEVLKRWNVGVVSRHTEPSCDWGDFKKMNPKQKAEIVGNMPYYVDIELVWSQDEVEILQRRGCKFPVYAIGSVTCDAYFRTDLLNKTKNRKAFNAKYKFSDKKKNLLIQSPWGFIDSAPDLRIDELDDAKKDAEGKKKHFEMIEKIHSALKDKWNILISIHPGVLEPPYQELAKKLRTPLDAATTSFELIVNSDALIHAGSTMSINAHLLKIPAYQYGDVNSKGCDNWWGMPEATISKLSPYFNKPDELIKAILNYKKASNANKKTLKALEKGRYGKMDGKATERAAELINKVEGKFEMRWPRSVRDYSQLSILRSPSKILKQAICAICKDPFWIINEEWLKMLETTIGKEAANKVRPKFGTCCPNCGSKYCQVK
jgi:hypothetical protein